MDRGSRIAAAPARPGLARRVGRGGLGRVRTRCAARRQQRMDFGRRRASFHLRRGGPRHPGKWRRPNPCTVTRAVGAPAGTTSLPHSECRAGVRDVRDFGAVHRFAGNRRPLRRGPSRSLSPANRQPGLRQVSRPRHGRCNQGRTATGAGACDARAGRWHRLAQTPDAGAGMAAVGQRADPGRGSSGSRRTGCRRRTLPSRRNEPQRFEFERGLFAAGRAHSIRSGNSAGRRTGLGGSRIGPTRRRHATRPG